MIPPSTRFAGLVEVSRVAMAQMPELLRAPARLVPEPVPEAVSPPAPTDRGRHRHMEVVELARIPPSPSILGSYEVETDEHGNVLSLRCFRRYARGEAGQA